MAASGHQWPDMQSMECSLCRAERSRRNRLLGEVDPHVCEDPSSRPRSSTRTENPSTEQAQTGRKHTLRFAATDSCSSDCSVSYRSTITRRPVCQG